MNAELTLSNMLSSVRFAAVVGSVLVLLVGCGNQDDVLAVTDTSASQTTLSVPSNPDDDGSPEHWLVDVFPSGDALGEDWSIDSPVIVEPRQSTGGSGETEDPQDWDCDSIPARTRAGDVDTELRTSYSLTNASERVFVLMYALHLTDAGAERYMNVAKFEGECLGSGVQVADIQGADDAISFNVDYEKLGYPPQVGNRSVITRKDDVIVSIFVSDENELDDPDRIVEDAVLRIPDDSD